MNYSKKIFISIFMSGFLLVAPSVHAMTPTLSVSSTGTGDNVQINVTGDPNVSVLLFVSTQSTVLGSTDANGNFSTTVSSATVVPNGIASNAIVYVKINGLNGPQSSSVSWPYIQSTSTSNLTLSQTALLLNTGQTSTITASANYLYLLSNSNPAIANINLNASQITVSALAYGSTVVNICVVGSTTNCSNIDITVQNSGAQQLTFSQNNFSLYSGQSINVAITGGSGSYTISNNSNVNSIQANLSGSTITLVATSTSGTAAITVCTTDMNYCGIVNVNATTVNSTAVTFSQTNPVVPLGQSTTVTIYGGTGNNFYVSSNSNPSIVQANITGNILTLIGNATTGTSTINICAYAGSCASLTANISNVSSGGAIALSQSSISILAGQNSNIIISGGSTPYSISSQNGANIFSSNLSGNTLTIYGVNPGTSTANVCASAGCATLTVIVSSTTSSVSAPTFSQNNILLNIGQQTTVSVSGIGNYYIANNSTSGIVSATINAGNVTVSAIQSGTDNISICQSGGQCSTLYVTVSSLNTQISNTTNSNTSSNSADTSTIISLLRSLGVDAATITNIQNSLSSGTPATTNNTATSIYIFPRYLSYNDKGADVLKLQQILVKHKFLSAVPTGHYGPATVAAVKKFQKANHIKQTGNIGPLTKGILDKILD